MPSHTPDAQTPPPGRLKHRLHAIASRLAAYRRPAAVILASLLSGGLLAARLVASGETRFAFLVWNLWLAWLPYVVALWAQRLERRHPGRWPALLVPGALWLVLFPNAPYLLTDLWHLRERPPIPLWYDLGMLVAFSLTGLFLAVYSLHIMQRLVRKYTGWLAGWLFVGVSLFLGGLGIYLGRFLRWNSWDLLFQPGAIATDLAVRLASPLSYPRTYGVTLLFAAVLFVCYLAMIPRDHPPAEPAFGGRFLGGAGPGAANTGKRRGRRGLDHERREPERLRRARKRAGKRAPLIWRGGYRSGTQPKDGARGGQREGPVPESAEPAPPPARETTTPG